MSDNPFDNIDSFNIDDDTPRGKPLRFWIRCKLCKKLLHVPKPNSEPPKHKCMPKS